MAIGAPAEPHVSEAPPHVPIVYVQTWVPTESGGHVTPAVRHAVQLNEPKHAEPAIGEHGRIWGDAGPAGPHVPPAQDWVEQLRYC